MNNTTPKPMKPTNTNRAEQEVDRFNKWMTKIIKNVHTANVQAMYRADAIVRENFMKC